MKKIAFISIAVLFLSLSAQAQLFQFGIKGGINFSTLQMDDIKGISDGSQVYDLVTGESVTGYQVGLMSRVNVAMFFVQPELYFNTTGGMVEQVVQNGANELLEVKFNRIDIPLLVGVKVGPARINAGPVGSAMINSVNELKSISQDLETLTGGLTWGYQAGVGIDLFKKLAIDLRYEGSLSKYGDSFTVNGADYALDARPTQVIFTVGYWF
ncbi:MAG: porin family protein [Bacteroidales bacterium]|nr:porin family protein [Bacteroidales bacterium]MDT8432874.1 porin family protein [Bacteroidales bacterium]